MRQCTPLGGRKDLPGLPKAQLYYLKQKLFELLPKYHRCPAAFEGLWSKCVEQIGQRCKYYRRVQAEK